MVLRNGSQVTRKRINKFSRGPGDIKNNQPYFWAVAGDGAGGTLGFGWFFTLEEAQAWFDGLNQGGGGAIAPKLYYLLLNKWYLGVLVNQSAAAVGLTSPAQDMWTTDKNVAKKFSQDTPGRVPWQIDTSQKKWVQNARIAEKIKTGVIGKTKVGTFQATVFQMLTLTINSLRLTSNILNRTVADLVENILNRLLKGFITQDQAVTEYETLVKQFHSVFF